MFAGVPVRKIKCAMDDVERIRAYYKAILPYYDASLEGRGDLPFWESIAARWNSTHVLELGCGTGRVTRVLANHARVTAVDLLIEMLHHVPGRVPDALLVAEDLRRFAFTTGFDLIILAADPMAHLTSSDDRAQAMRLIADHLNPGGRVVIEGLYRSKPIRSSKELWEPAGEESIWNATYRYGAVEAKSTFRSWTLDEAHRIEEFGLHVEHIWGDFDESPFEAHSPRIIIVARAPRSSRRAL
jgi:SAM-dependent methyltransferase